MNDESSDSRPFFALLAFILVLAGFWNLFAGNGWWALGLFVAACAIGPGGWTIYKRRNP